VQNAFLLGLIAMASLTSGLFFLKFWNRSRDPLFLAFAISFLIEAVNRVVVLNLPNPSEASPWTYIVRLLAFAIILTAVIRKNFGNGQGA
jgi:hypothetical protein